MTASRAIPTHANPDAEDLRARLTGVLITPADPEYDTARQVWNAVVDRHPAFIVRAADAADVARTIAFATDAGLEIAVRGGGHSMSGQGVADDAVVIDMGAMRSLYIDTDRRIAWAQPGLTTGEYTAAAAAHGLATPFGDTGTVGIAGLTLGGGVGFLARKHGLAIDSLIAVELVTADGRILHVDERNHPDLFWAVRGGGGNFGVVTRLVFRLHPIGTVLAGALFLPATAEVLRGAASIALAAPEELTTIWFLMPAPPAPFIPAEHVGKLSLAIMLVHAGDHAAGQPTIDAFRALATPYADVVGPMHYPAIYQFTAEGERRTPSAHRSLFLDAFSHDTIDTILEWMRAPSSPVAMVQIRVFGGAMARVPVDATAFAHRTQPYMVTLITPFEDPAQVEIHEAWTEAFYDELAPAANGVYVNFLGDEGEARIHEAYPAGTYERLVSVKRRYDPTNVFHGNQNIAPAGPEGAARAS